MWIILVRTFRQLWHCAVVNVRVNIYRVYETAALDTSYCHIQCSYCEVYDFVSYIKWKLRLTLTFCRIHLRKSVHTANNYLNDKPDLILDFHTDISGCKFLKYTEDISKTHQGSLKHRGIAPKCVDPYQNKDSSSRCIVRIYEMYISHMPSDMKCSPSLYLRPLDQPKTNVWYSCQAVGINEITKTVKRLCSEAGLSGFRSNHSLRATAASRLYSKNFDEQLISQTTGHRSVALRSYKRTSSGQKKVISHGLRAMPSSSPSCTVTSASPSRTVTSASPSCTVTSPTYVNQDATSGFNVTFNINMYNI